MPFSFPGAGSGATSGAQLGSFGGLPGMLVGGSAGALLGGFLGGGKERRRGGDDVFGRLASEQAEHARRALGTLGSIAPQLAAGQLPFDLQPQIDAIRRAEMANINDILPKEQKAALQPLAAIGFLRSGRAAEQTRRVAENFGLRLTNLEASQAESEINRRLSTMQTGLGLLSNLAGGGASIPGGLPPEARSLTSGQEFLQALAPISGFVGQERMRQDQFDMIRNLLGTGGGSTTPFTRPNMRFGGNA